VVSNVVSIGNGVTLDAGQAALVRSMCTSGARLQLAIAPGRRRKDHCDAPPRPAWSDSGGQVVGLAPSAAAAAQLRCTRRNAGQAHLVHPPQCAAGLGACRDLDPAILRSLDALHLLPP
jgi:hypothetical protein